MTRGKTNLEMETEDTESFVTKNQGGVLAALAGAAVGFLTGSPLLAFLGLASGLLVGGFALDKAGIFSGLSSAQRPTSPATDQQVAKAVVIPTVGGERDAMREPRALRSADEATINGIAFDSHFSEQNGSTVKLPDVPTRVTAKSLV